MYIIYEADLLSVSAANTILKFLEEPEEGIVGFFITSRLSSMLPTITSRCELINMRYGNNSVLDLLNISEEEYMAYYNIAKHMIDVLNYKTIYERLYKANDITKYEREEIIKVFKIIHNIYVIKFENIINNEYNNLEYAQEILNIIDEKDPSLIAKRIKNIEQFLNDFKYNVNKELFINKLFITWE
jgi:DNA polymerase III gamma/tau subunit